MCYTFPQSGFTSWTTPWQPPVHLSDEPSGCFGGMPVLKYLNRIQYPLNLKLRICTASSYLRGLVESIVPSVGILDGIVRLGKYFRSPLNFVGWLYDGIKLKNSRWTCSKLLDNFDVFSKCILGEVDLGYHLQNMIRISMTRIWISPQCSLF